MSQFLVITKNPRINEVLRVLHLQPQLNTDQLAKMVDLGKSRLRHLFRSEVGVSLTDYILEIRLQQAWRLLTTTYLSVKEIANRVGIPDASNFNHRFKDKFHISPTKARESRFNQQKAVLTNENELPQAEQVVFTGDALQQEP